MEVDEEGEDEVIVVEEAKQGEMRKWAPLSLPKMLRQGMSGDSDTNASGESGAGEFRAGESGRVGECGEHRKAMLEVCEAQS